GLGMAGHRRATLAGIPRLPSGRARAMAPDMSAEVVPLPVKQPSLAPILSLTATAMNAVNAIILDRMQSEIPLIPALAGHLIAGGGKRMRPMLTHAGAELVGYQGARHHKLTAAVEFIH